MNKNKQIRVNPQEEQLIKEMRRLDIPAAEIAIMAANGYEVIANKLDRTSNTLFKYRSEQLNILGHKFQTGEK